MKTRILIFLFIAFVFIFNLGERTLENQDNIRFAEVGREILETGDWIMMHLSGEVYVDKPPLHFWNIALSYKIFGVNSFGARFPSAFFAILGVFSILFFGNIVDKENPKTSIYSAFFLCSSYAYLNYARSARIDLEFSVLFSISLILFYIGFSSEKNKLRALFYALFWFFVGLAFLSKGPIVFLSVIIAIIYLLAQRDVKRSGIKEFVLTSVVVLIIVTPWIYFLIKHKEFEEYLYLLRNSKIMTRRESFYYYLYAFPLNYFPATIFTAISIPAIWKLRKEIKRQSGVFFCIVWCVVYFIMVHFTIAKNIRYLLPIFIPISIVTAWAIQRVRYGRDYVTKIKKYILLISLIIGIFVTISPTVWVIYKKTFSINAFLITVIGLILLFFTYVRLKDVIIFTCILCIIGFLSVDVIRASFNSKVSYSLEIYNLLKENKIDADEIILYRIDPEVRKRLSFYFNRLITQKDEPLRFDNKIKVLITSPHAINDLFALNGVKYKYVRIKNRQGKDDHDIYVVFLKKVS